ncbi:MAG: enoyl-CoA hydratase [Chloroflexi bacterium]|nr:enoyl-CoA hydratase [Chloroflexota bacterium]|tara:strand:- start:1841 stop:2644 length:804 start_codon:yes stop_codon:yes gene_type:complete
MTEYQDLLYTKEGNIAIITLNRPEVLNAFSMDMLRSWLAALQDAKDDDDVRVVVVTGAGRGFCAGADVKARAARQKAGTKTPYGDPRHIQNDIHPIPKLLQTLDKPYIAAINGPCAGAGMDMASMCDIRLASDNAKFVMAYVRRATVPGDGGCYLLPRIVGLTNALDLMWTGRAVDAQEALRIGYVNRVVSQEDLMQQTMEYARELASGPPLAIRLIKRLTYDSLAMNLESALNSAGEAALVVHNSEDYKEGALAFVEKRPPRWLGR